MALRVGESRIVGIPKKEMQSRVIKRVFLPSLLCFAPVCPCPGKRSAMHLDDVTRNENR